MQSRIPLLEALDKMAGSLPMHMPGHKRNPLWGDAGIGFLDRKLYELDFTEVAGLDDLHAPQGVIGEAQALAADCFHAKHTFFLVNGASVGMMAAVISCCGEGNKILLPRNAHRCVFEALVLSGASPVWYRPQYDDELALPVEPCSEQVEELIRQHRPKAMVLINPTYHGAACDSSLLGKAGSSNVVTIVDEAHGSHFLFDHRLPRSALEAGADMVVHSTHKTLGSLTQTGLLHLGTDNPGPEQVGKVLSLLQSTSPSYLLMASLDAMRGELAARGNTIVGRCVDLALELRSRIRSIPGFSCGELKCRAGCDPTKILLRSSRMRGRDLGEILRCEYGIFAEIEDEPFILLMVTVGDTQESIDRLVSALKDISGRKHHRHPPGRQLVFDSLPEVVLTPRQAFSLQGQKCSLKDSAGKISGSLVVPYPPGVPLLCPGERISREIVEYIYSIKANNHHLQGMDCTGDLKLFVLEC